MTTEFQQKLLIIIILPIIIAFFYFTAASHFEYTPDDTYIYLQYARNLLQGEGIAFNSNEPSYGFTSPLWLFIITFCGLVVNNLYTVAKVLDLFFAGCALIVFYLVSIEIIQDKLASIFSTIAFSIHVWFIRWAGTGLETSLSVLLLLLAILFCIRNNHLLSIVVAALLFHVRPETIFLSILILADTYIKFVSNVKTKRKIIKLAVIYTLILLPWLTYSLITFGNVISNTALAKVGWRITIDGLFQTSLRSFQILLFSDGVAIIALILGIILTIIINKKKPPLIPHTKEEKHYFFQQSFVGLGWVVILLLFYIISDANVVSRYILLAVPLIIIFSFRVLYYIFVRLGAIRYLYIGMLVLSALIMIQNQVIYQHYVRPHIKSFEDGMKSCLIPIGTWLKENTESGAIIFTPDIGAIGYFSERPICDAAGLISPTILSFIRQGYTMDEMIENKIYSIVCNAEYVVHRASIPEALSGDPSLIALFYRPFYSISMRNQGIQYYTVYKVKSVPHLTDKI